MALLDPPTITIGNTVVSNSWTETNRIALDGLKITWGRRSHYDDAKPAQLYVELLDTDGHLASYTHLTGRRISVTRGDGRVIFRGRIDDYTIEQIWAWDPHLMYRRRVWRLGISAADKLAQLAQAHLPGGGEQEDMVAKFGPEYWSGNLNQVWAQLDAAGVSNIVSFIAQPTPPDGLSLSDEALAPQSYGDASVLDLITGVYRAEPLGHAIYNADEDWVVCGTPARTAGLELEWDGDTLSLDLPDGLVIPARTVAVPDGYRAGTGIDEAIDVVNVTSTRMSRVSDDTLEFEWADWTISDTTARYNASTTGRRELDIETFILYNAEEYTPGTNIEAFAWPFSLNNVTSEFGWRDWSNSFHEGIDFSYDGIGGDDIHAAADGTVFANDFSSGWGNYVILFHGTVQGADLYTLYAHMVTPSPLIVDAHVQKGDVLGQVGQTGNSTGDHLHFETHVTTQGGSLAWNTTSPSGTRTAVNPRQFFEVFGKGETTPPELVRPAGEWAHALVTEVADMLDQLNGKLKLPTLRLDWRRFDYDPIVGQEFIDSGTKQVAMYFPGSVFNVALDAAGEHQIIGGTLVYHDGWTLDATVAPAIGTGAGVTINQLVQIDAPTIADFDPDITIADLGNVTRGVTA